MKVKVNGSWVDVPAFKVKEGGGGLTAIEGTYTPSSDVRSTSMSISDARLSGKTIIAAYIVCKAVYDDSAVNGVAAIFAANNNLKSEEISSILEWNGCSLSGSAQGSYTSGYAKLNITDDTTFSLSYVSNRWYKGGYTYNWKVYVL